MDYLGQLAACVHDIKLSSLPASTVAAAKLVLLDTIGAIVAGSVLPENARLARMAAKRSPHGLSTLLGLLITSRLPSFKLSPRYDPRFSADRFGIEVTCEAAERRAVEDLLRGAGAEEVRG